MISESFLDYINKQKYDTVIYPNDLFDLRVQEEMIRADEYKSFFVYAEFLFESIHKALPADDEKKFWKAVFKSFATQGRGSDVMGFLENDKGIGILLIDSEMNGWQRLAGRIREYSKDSIADISKPLNSVKAFVYPAYIATENT